MKRYKTQYNGKNDLLKWKQSIKKIREDNKGEIHVIKSKTLNRSKDVYLDKNSNDAEEEEKLQKK